MQMKNKNEQLHPKVVVQKSATFVLNRQQNEILITYNWIQFNSELNRKVFENRVFHSHGCCCCCCYFAYSCSLPSSTASGIQPNSQPTIHSFNQPTLWSGWSICSIISFVSLFAVFQQETPKPGNVYACVLVKQLFAFSFHFECLALPTHSTVLSHHFNVLCVVPPTTNFLLNPHICLLFFSKELQHFIVERYSFVVNPADDWNCYWIR